MILGKDLRGGKAILYYAMDGGARKMESIKLVSRLTILAFVALTSVASLVAASTFPRGFTAVSTEKHFSIDAPALWSLERNYTSGDLFMDLLLHGPSDGGHTAPVCALVTYPWISDRTPYEIQKNQLDLMKTDPAVTDMRFVSWPVNITADRERANRVTVTFQSNGSNLEFIGLWILGMEWGLTYNLEFLDDAADWDLVSSTFEKMIGSIHIDGQEGTSSLFAVGVAFTMIATAVVVVTLMLLRRRRRIVRFAQPTLQEVAAELSREPGIASPGEPEKP